MAVSNDYLRRLFRSDPKPPAEPNLLALVGRNWSSGRDEEFGGYFVCVHGLNEQQKNALIAAGRAAKKEIVR